MTESRAEGSSSRYAWYVVGVLTLANVLGFIDRQILSLLVAPIRRDLGLSLTQMSYLIGLPFAIFFTVMALPLGRLADARNRRNIISAGIALWSLMTAFCGLAGTFSRLLLARIGVGVGEAWLQPSATSMLADYFPREKLGGAMSVYSTGIFLGSGLAYFIGGWIVGLVSAEGTFQLPVIGAIRPWQTVFMLVGVPGLVVAALLLLTVREPERRDHSRGTVSVRELLAYVRANLRAMTSLGLGFALYATSNFAIAAWLPTFLMQRYGWTASRAGMVQGVLTMTLGVAGVVAGGRLSDALARRGYTDSALRVGIVGAAGMLVSATAYPLMPTAAAAVVWLAIVNVFAAFPWGAATAAAAQIVPASMRAQGVALFAIVLNFVSLLLGPWSVAAITDSIFKRDTALPYSLAIVNVLAMIGAIALFLIGLPAYRRSLASREASP